MTSELFFPHFHSPLQIRLCLTLISNSTQKSQFPPSPGPRRQPPSAPHFFLFFKQTPLCFLPQAQEKPTVNIHIIVFEISLKLSFATMAIKLLMTLAYYLHINLCLVHRTYCRNIFPPALFGNIKLNSEKQQRNVSKKIKNMPEWA